MAARAPLSAEPESGIRTRPLAVVVLAAGRGTRFPGVVSKVLVSLAGRSLVEHVLAAAATQRPERTVVVVGHARDAVIEVVRRHGVETVDQGEPRGTGHALLATESLLGKREQDLLVLNGDVPLLRPATLGRLRAALGRRGVAAALLTVELDRPGAYGRIQRDRDGVVRGIVEAADATDEELAIREINVGAYALRAPEAFRVLHRLGDANAQGEIYLTDAVRRLVEASGRVEAVVLEDPLEGQGVNTPEDQAALEAAFAAGGW